MTQKERIVHESGDLFFQKGVRNVTMNDIAEHLGMSKRTIYEHIADKDELLALCIKEFERKTHDELLKAAEEANADLIDILSYFVDFVISSMSSNVGRFFSEVKKYHPQVYIDVAEAHKKTKVEHLTQFIDEGIKEGFFLPMHNPEIVALLILDTFALTNKGEDMEKFITPESLRKLVLVFFRGIATLKGIERIDEAFHVKYEENS